MSNASFKSRQVSITIGLPPDKVYDFVSNPQNLPSWAGGLSGSIENVNGEWVAESPMGKVKIKFADKNMFGVLDHDVTLPSGETFYNPMRVVSNGNGSELIFTLYQRPGMSETDFKKDEEQIKKDLEKLRTLVEKPPT
ncbi:MAG TPA: hypothetical protein VH415_14910 [Nitrososphaeraceae archaeon]|jgi:hypothetical protein